MESHTTPTATTAAPAVRRKRQKMFYQQITTGTLDAATQAAKAGLGFEDLMHTPYFLPEELARYLVFGGSFGKGYGTRCKIT